MKLSYAPRTRATRARWLLEELDVPYELVRVDPAKGEAVPVLVDGDVTLSESSAICLYLADRFPEKQLAPPLGSSDRGPYLQWLLFAEVTLEPLVLERSARLDEVLTVVDARLDGREFIAAGSFTAADVVLASILHLANTLKLLEKYPRLVDYVLRHTRRPATMRAVSG